MKTSKRVAVGGVEKLIAGMVENKKRVEGKKENHRAAIKWAVEFFKTYTNPATFTGPAFRRGLIDLMAYAAELTEWQHLGNTYHIGTALETRLKMMIGQMPAREYKLLSGEAKKKLNRTTADKCGGNDSTIGMTHNYKHDRTRAQFLGLFFPAQGLTEELKAETSRPELARLEKKIYGDIFYCLKKGLGTANKNLITGLRVIEQKQIKPMVGEIERQRVELERSGKMFGMVATTLERHENALKARP